VVRLIRSKGVGVYFVTQNPLDIPETVLGQLGNRVQHALRAFTPRDQKAVKAAADTLRANPAFDAATVITELGVGEALVSFLDEQGRPTVVERGFVLAPASRIGPLTVRGTPGRDCRFADRRPLRKGCSIANPPTKNSRARRSRGASPVTPRQKSALAARRQPRRSRPADGFFGGIGDALGGMLGGGARAGSRGRQTVVEAAVSSTVRAIGSSLGREIVRGVLGSIMGGRRR
jgi:hypothetical protein